MTIHLPKSPPTSPRHRIRRALRVLVLLSLAHVCVQAAPEPAAYRWSGVAIGGGGYVSGIVYHPDERNLRYARTDVGGAYRWDAAAERWIALNDDIGGLDNEFMTLGVLSLALDPRDPDRVYLACGQYIAPWAPPARLLRSTDRGATWTQVELPFKLPGNQDGRGTGERLAVDPRDGSRLLLGTGTDGLWSSTDHGATWKRVTAFPPTSTTFVLHDPNQAGVIYVGAADLTGPTLWRSTDDGVSWAPVPGQKPGLMALQGKIDSAGTLYLTYADAIGPNGATAGAVRKLARAATAGSTSAWTDIDPPPGTGGYCGLALHERSPGVVVVATLDRWGPRDELYRSTDGGATWKALLDAANLDWSRGAWARTLVPHWITDVEIDPFDSSRAVFVTGFGLFTTRDLDVRSGVPVWAFDNAGLEETVPTGLVSPAEGPPLISTIGDFDGFRHDKLDTPPAERHAPRKGTNRGLVGAGSAPAVLARLHDGSGSISRDGGTSWTLFASAPPAASKGDGRLALSADGARLLWCPPGSGAWWSADDGRTWTASTGAADGAGGNLVPAGDSVAPAHFYLHDPASRRVLRSVDGGAGFEPAGPRLSAETRALRPVPGRAGELWAVCDRDGLHRLADHASALAPLSSVQAAYALGFGRAAPGASHPAAYIWGTVGGVTGIHRSDDAGVSWTRVNDDARQFGHIGAITGDPRVFGRVYLGTSGRGILVGEPAAPSLAE